MTPPDKAAAAFEEHRRAVEAFAARILLDAEEARDVASDAFASLVETGPDDERATLAWLLRSARNRAVDRIRGRERSRRRAVPERDRFEHETELPLARERVGALVRDGLDRLEARDRRALELRYLEARSYAEIGAALRVSEPQARVIVHRAAGRMRRALLELLAEHHGAPNACRTRLSEGVLAHAGCGPCAAVADEVAVLASFVVAPVPLVARIAHHVAPVVERAPVREGGRLVEAVAALAMIGSMAVAPAAPVAGADPGPGRERVHAPARDVAAPRSGPAAAAPRVPDAARALAQRDAAGDPALARGLPSPVLRMVVADLTGDMTPALDIVAFGIEPVRRAGQTRGLRFRWDLAAEPTNDGAYRVHWVAPGGRCWADLGTSPASAGGAVLVATCGLGSDVVREFVPATATVGTRSVTIEVSFDGLDGNAAAVIGPGARLRRLRASTAFGGAGMTVWSNVEEADVAPEYGRTARYRVPV